LTPSTTLSSMPPTAVDTTGLLQAIASSATMPNGSYKQIGQRAGCSETMAFFTACSILARSDFCRYAPLTGPKPGRAARQAGVQASGPVPQWAQVENHSQPGSARLIRKPVDGA
jgi:hypothetical protein